MPRTDGRPCTPWGFPVCTCITLRRSDVLSVQLSTSRVARGAQQCSPSLLERVKTQSPPSTSIATDLTLETAIASSTHGTVLSTRYPTVPLSWYRNGLASACEITHAHSHRPQSASSKARGPGSTVVADAKLRTDHRESGGSIPLVRYRREL